MSPQKPVALIILDGYGLREKTEGNAIAQANTPFFDQCWQEYPHTTLTASGEAVGLPEGQMGNSEVGHLNIGSGRIVFQDLTRISRAIEKGFFFQNEVLVEGMKRVKEKKGSRLHLMGLLSDGGVHSHIRHLYALLKMAKEQGVQEVMVHAFLDGRDVPYDSGLQYIQQLQGAMQELRVGQLATIHGRYFAMDRDTRWDRIEKSYRAIVYGEGPTASDPLDLIQESYQKKIYDEFVEPTVLVNSKGHPIGLLNSDDGVIFFNFRPDRAIQLSQAINNEHFEGFFRGEQPPQALEFICLTEYSASVNGHVAFPGVNLENTYGQVISQQGLKQLRIAETEKYPHVTFFFSGGREEAFPGEDRILINSPDVATYDLKPEMSAYEVTEALEKAIHEEIYDTFILNFANPDMVGHSGKLQPTIQAVEAVDICLERVIKALHAKEGVAVIIADHGNADMVVDGANRPVTSHTTAPVPCIVTDTTVTLRTGGILADVAPTLLQLMGFNQPKEMTGTSLIQSIS